MGMGMGMGIDRSVKAVSQTPGTQAPRRLAAATAAHNLQMVGERRMLPTFSVGSECHLHPHATTLAPGKKGQKVAGAADSRGRIALASPLESR